MDIVFVSLRYLAAPMGRSVIILILGCVMALPPNLDKAQRVRATATFNKTMHMEHWSYQHLNTLHPPPMPLEAISALITIKELV